MIHRTKKIPEGKVRVTLEFSKGLNTKPIIMTLDNFNIDITSEPNKTYYSNGQIVYSKSNKRFICIKGEEND